MSRLLSISLDACLQEVEEVPWRDPHVASAIETSGTGLTTSPRAMSEAPNRLTMEVPCTGALSFVNLGEADPRRRHTYHGLSFATQGDVRWETSTTYLNLGVGLFKGHWGVPLIPENASGFTMVTQGNAYLHADGQHLFTVTGEDAPNDLMAVAKSGKTAVLQSDHGAVEVLGGDAVQVSAANNVHLMVPDGGGDHDRATYATPWPKTTQTMCEERLATMATAYTYVGGLASTAAAVLAVTNHAANFEQAGSRLQVAAGAVKLGQAALQVTSAAFSSSSASSRENLTASGPHVVLSGTRSATMFGMRGAFVGSLGAASVTGGTCDIKGTATVGVWGRHASLQCKTDDACVLAGLGSTYIDAFTVASLVAEKLVRIVGKNGASIRGTAVAALSGKGTYLGAGTGSAAHGLVATPKAVFVGPVENADSFLKVDSPGRVGVAVTEDAAGARYEDSALWLQSAKATMVNKGAFVRVTKDSFLARGERVVLD